MTKEIQPISDMSVMVQESHQLFHSGGKSFKFFLVDLQSFSLKHSKNSIRKSLLFTRMMAPKERLLLKSSGEFMSRIEIKS